MNAARGYENRIASLLAGALDLPVEYTWFSAEDGFHPQHAPAREPDGEYKCDVVMGLARRLRAGDHDGALLPLDLRSRLRAGPRARRRQIGRDLLALEPSRRETLRFGLAERNPGTVWLAKHGLLDRIAVAYASQHGDPEVHPGQLEQEDLLADRINVTIMWGPIAGHFARSNPDVPITVIPMASEPGCAPALRDLRRSPDSDRRRRRRSCRRCSTTPRMRSRPSCVSMESPSWTRMAPCSEGSGAGGRERSGRPVQLGRRSKREGGVAGFG